MTTTALPEDPAATEGGAEELASPRALPPVTLSYVPAFDGLRGFLLPAILIYHHGFELIPGGVFLVSMFFTLSGFLIATLSLSEMSATGKLSLAKFWERRARRLLPAALATLVFILLLERLVGVGSGPRFKGDMLSAIGYVANWRMAYSGADYAAIFTNESTVQHFWSLAIEEQFYLFFPLVLVGLLRVTKGRWGLVGVLFGAGAAASFAASWVIAVREQSNTGLAYYATYTRVSEILVGVALAFAMITRPARAFLSSSRGATIVGWVGIVGLLGQFYLWRQVALTDPLMFQGGTIVNSFLTVLCVLACFSPRPGILVKFLSLGLMRNFGKLTYGVYLIHWPLYLWINEERTGLSTWPLFVVRVGATVGLAVLMYHYIESPARTARRVSGRVLLPLLVVPAVLIAAIVLLLPTPSSDQIDLASINSDDNPSKPDAVVPEDGAEPAARLLVIGDSVSWSTLNGYQAWNEANPDQQVHVDAYYAIGCTIGEAGHLRALGLEEDPFESCRNFRALLPAALDQADYDAVIVVMGQKDTTDRLLDGEWTHAGEPRFDEWFATQVDALADILATEGAPVLWAENTHVFVARANDPSSNPEDYPDNDPARMDRLNELIRAQLADRPGFTLLELDEWLSSVPGGEFSVEYRADLAHYTPRGSAELADFVLPQVFSQTGPGPLDGAAPD